MIVRTVEQAVREARAAAGQHEVVPALYDGDPESRDPLPAVHVGRRGIGLSLVRGSIEITDKNYSTQRRRGRPGDRRVGRAIVSATGDVACAAVLTRFR